MADGSEFPEDFSAPEVRHPAEIYSSAVGKSPAEVAAVDRVLAGLRERAVSSLRFRMAAVDATGALRNFVDAWQRSEERLSQQEAADVAHHPDLAELNVRLDALYETP